MWYKFVKLSNRTYFFNIMLVGYRSFKGSAGKTNKSSEGRNIAIRECVIQIAVGYIRKR